MKRTIQTVLFSLAVICMALGPAQTAQAQFGIAGGLNFESADDLDTGDDVGATLDNKTGYHVGVVYDFDLGPASIRPGVFYRRVGTYVFEVGDIQIEDETFDMTAIEVPIDARFRVFSTPAVRPYVLAGPMATFPRGEDEFDDAMEDVSFSFNVGAGIGFGQREGGGVQILPEIRYEFGATKFIEDDFEIGDTTFEPQNEPRFSALSLRLHILF